MSANVEFNITAFDQASSVFENVSNSANECFSTVETSASEAAGTVSTSASRMESSVKSASFSLKDNALAMNNLGTASMALYGTIDRVESSQTALDRANLTVERSTQSLAKAQQDADKAGRDLEAAQVAVEQAVEEYGEGSIEAEKAQQKLNDAQTAYKNACDKLPIAQDAVTLAQERQKQAQDNANKSYIEAGLTVIPSVITATTSLNTLFATTPAIEGAVATATGAVSSAMTFLAANPIILVIAGIAALAIGLFEAYQHCAPFRDAINAIGAVLGGTFKMAVAGISDALNFLWNNIFKPFGEFLANVFINLYLKPLQSAWDALSSGLQWIWHNVLEPVAGFFKGALTSAINFVMAPINMFESAISKIANLAKPLTDIIGGLGNALRNLCFAHAAPAAEEFNKQVMSSIELSNSLTQKLDPLKQGLLGVAGSTGNANVNGLNNGTQHITVNPTINIGKIDRSTGLSDVINAVNQGTAQALQRRF